MTIPTSELTIDLGYRSRPQFAPFHLRKQRWACLVAHRRAGKTVACVMDLVDAALRCDKPNARFAYLAPTYTQAKDVAWGYLKRFTQELPGVEQRESDLAVILSNGARVRLYGAENYDRLRGIFLDGIVLDEFADIDPRAWPEVIRPALSDRKGWAVFIGTPKGKNEFYRVWQRAQTDPTWFALMLRASETKLLDAGELEDLRKMLTPEQFEQELECSFDAAIMGAYYAQELADADRAQRIGDFEPDPSLPVHTAWDLGVGDSTAIWWWQSAGSEIRVVDYYEAHGHGLEHYAAVCRAKPYKRGDDWVPHDAKVREFGSGRTRIETMITAGLKPRLVPDHRLEDGINATRLTIPRCWFNAERCGKAIELLRMYREDWDEKANVSKGRPKHDHTSHCSDSFRYLSMAWRELHPEAPKERGRVLSIGAGNEVTMEDLMPLHGGKGYRRI